MPLQLGLVTLTPQTAYGRLQHKDQYRYPIVPCCTFVQLRFPSQNPDPYVTARAGDCSQTQRTGRSNRIQDMHGQKHEPTASATSTGARPQKQTHTHPQATSRPGDTSVDQGDCPERHPHAMLLRSHQNLMGLGPTCQHSGLP